eukprot:scaffold24860_cov98-Isochrysis_galbana.AAC.2
MTTHAHVYLNTDCRRAQQQAAPSDGWRDPQTSPIVASNRFILHTVRPQLRTEPWIPQSSRCEQEDWSQVACKRAPAGAADPEPTAARQSATAFGAWALVGLSLRWQRGLHLHLPAGSAGVRSNGQRASCTPPPPLPLAAQTPRLHRCSLCRTHSAHHIKWASHRSPRVAPVVFLPLSPSILVSSILQRSCERVALLIAECFNLLVGQGAAKNVTTCRLTTQLRQVVPPLPLKVSQELKAGTSVLPELLLHVRVAKLAVRRRQRAMRHADVTVELEHGARMTHAEEASWLDICVV